MPKPTPANTEQKRNLSEAKRRMSSACEETDAAVKLLDLSDLGLPAIPPSKLSLAHITHLDLSGNALTAIPEWVRSMARLTLLRVDSNTLRTFPCWIDELSQLKILSASNNRIATLPHNLFLLNSLEELHLSGNRFHHIPPLLGELHRLKTLSLANNSGLEIPSEILATQEPTTILTYVRKLNERGGRQPLNEAKLILVGRGFVGKTTLVHQLLHHEFLTQEKTTGIEVTEWDVPGQASGANNITVHIWDFGGQEIMHGTHQFFLTERSLYLLVVSGRENREDDDTEYWMQMIEAFGGDSPVIVVLNKFNEHTFELNEGALKAKYPNIQDFIRTDCKTHLGIDELRTLIVKRIQQMDGVRAVFPSSWFQIKDKISATLANFMSLDAFRDVCAENGEAISEEQDHLAGVLHILGIALNFRDDPRLRETSILNPRWVTEGIYTLLNDENLRLNKGIFSLSDVRRVLDTNEYPEEIHDFLVRLMKKFELCFPIDATGKQYLIPELLGKNQPTLGPHFVAKGSLGFEYHYNGLIPEGLLPRFIVRAYTRIVDDLLWRSGVVLSWGDCLALVKADEAERVVQIRIVGDFSTRREFLTLIREHFAAIHRNFKKLRPAEIVCIPNFPGLLVDFAELKAAANDGLSWEKFYKGRFLPLNARAILDTFTLPS